MTNESSMSEMAVSNLVTELEGMAVLFIAFPEAETLLYTHLKAQSLFHNKNA